MRVVAGDDHYSWRPGGVSSAGFPRPRLVAVIKSGKLKTLKTGGRAIVAVDVHYLGSGGARAAAVVAADARFSEIVAERTEDVAEVLPYRPGEFYLRELPPIRTVLSGLSGLGLLVVDVLRRP
jgi:deoxyinosine 3'endonuclease (endonuclease V)